MGKWFDGIVLSTPVEPLEIIVGKLAPYAVLGIVVCFTISGFFQIPFNGSLWVFGSGCILFLITYLAQGLLISVVTRSQQVAVIAIMSGLLPAQLSGFIF